MEEGIQLVSFYHDHHDVKHLVNFFYHDHHGDHCRKGNGCQEWEGHIRKQGRD